MSKDSIPSLEEAFSILRCVGLDPLKSGRDGEAFVRKLLERRGHPVCGACEGTGRLPLTLDLRDTLAVVRGLAAEGSDIDAPTVTRLLGEDVVPGTINNRLGRLCEYGILRRAGKRGRRVVYELTAEGGSDAPR